MTDIDARDLARRYVAVWTERDAELRRKAIHGLTGYQFIEPDDARP